MALPGQQSRNTVSNRSSPFSTGGRSTVFSGPGGQTPARSGGRGGSRNRNTSTTTEEQNFTPVPVNVQLQSEQKAIEARTLLRQNVENQRNANQSESSYALNTGLAGAYGFSNTGRPSITGGRLGASGRAKYPDIEVESSSANSLKFSPPKAAVTSNPFAMNTNTNPFETSGRQDLLSSTRETSVNKKGFFGRANAYVAERTTVPAYNFINKITGVDLTSAKDQSAFAPSLIGVGSFGYSPKQFRDVYGGFQAGINTEIRDKPVSTASKFAAGYGAGLVLQGSSIGASLISPGLSSGVKVAGYGAGAISTGIYGYQTGRSVLNAGNSIQAGSILGKSFVDTTAIGLGIGSGIKGANKIQGLVSTRGRTEIPFSELTQKEVLIGEKRFPEIARSNQLKTFQTGRYKDFVQPLELTQGKQGGFHTTPSRFYSKAKDITPTAGSSELPGLYISPYISPNFAKIPGSSGGSLLPNIKSFFAPSGRPGVAFIKPEGFRYSSFSFKFKPSFTGQKSVQGRFAVFDKPAKKGIADVPLMKTEAEAILRIDGGSYSLESSKFFTKIEGVRVPIDVFGFKGGKGGADVLNLKDVSISRGGYNVPTKVSSYSPISGFIPTSYSFRPSSSPRSFYSSPSSTPPSFGSNSSGSSSSSPFSGGPSFPSSPSSSPSSFNYNSFFSSPVSLSSSFSSSIPSFPYSPNKELGGFLLSKPKKKGRKSPFDIAPGFSSIVTGTTISSPIKVSKTFGVSPFTTRGLPTFKTGSYFKLTNL